jgi:hypothetical protein
VGPRAGLEAVKKKKTSCHHPESNPGHPARSPSLYGLSYPGSYWEKVRLNVTVILFNI